MLPESAVVLALLVVLDVDSLFVEDDSVFVVFPAELESVL